MAAIIDINTLFGPMPAAASDLSVAELVELMARHGVGQSCTLSTVGVLLDHTAGNTATRAACAELNRLLPAATLNPRCHFRGGAASRLRAEGFRLVRFFPELQGWSPDSAAFREIVRELEDEGLPVMVDVHGPGMATRVVEALGGHPSPVILAGVEADTLSEAVWLMRRCDAVHVETSSLLAEGAIRQAAEAVGPHRLLFGSGAPSRPVASGLRVLRHAGLDEEHAALVLGENARRVLSV